MTQVRLLGELGEKFGTEWTSQQSSVREILKLIDCQVDGFKEYLGECHEKNVQFSIQNGDDFIEEFEELGLQGIVKDTLIITPVPAGSGKGLGKLIAAALLIAAFIFMPGSAGMFANVGAQGTLMTSSGTMMAASQASIAQLVGGTYLAGGAGATAVAGATVGLNFAGMAVAMLGVNLAFMGLAEMSAPDAGGMESDPAFLFNSANSNVEQGQPVPVLYGRLKIGGTPISQGFQAGDLKNSDTVYDTD
jgi:predicted phage tail protein